MGGEFAPLESSFGFPTIKALDFAREGSVSRAMKRETASAAISACIGLTDAARSEALDIEPLLNEADSLLQAAAAIRRCVDPPWAFFRRLLLPRQR